VSDRVFLALLVLLGTAMRLLAVAVLRDVSAGPDPAFGDDGFHFEAMAWNLAAHSELSITMGHPTAFRAPAFPAVLGAVYAMFGRSYAAAYALQAILGGLAAPIAYLLCQRLGVSGWNARFAAIAVALHFGLVYYATHFASEPLFVLLAGVSALLATASSRWAMPASGWMLGIAALARPQALFVLPALPLWRHFGAPPEHHYPRRLVMASAGFALALAPWIMRNAKVLGRPVPFTTNGGGTLYGANNDSVARTPELRGWWIATNGLPGRRSVDAATHEADADRLEYALGTTWIRSHPAAFGRLALHKFGNLLLPWDRSTNRRYTMLAGICVAPILALLLIGTAAAWRRRELQLLLPAGTAFLGIAVQAMVFYGSARFRDAFFLLFVPLVARGMEAITDRLRSKPTAA
jgi:hypothetical protein